MLLAVTAPLVNCNTNPTAYPNTNSYSNARSQTYIYANRTHSRTLSQPTKLK